MYVCGTDEGGERRRICVLKHEMVEDGLSTRTRTLSSSVVGFCVGFITVRGDSTSMLSFSRQICCVGTTWVGSTAGRSTSIGVGEAASKYPQARRRWSKNNVRCIAILLLRM